MASAADNHAAAAAPGRRGARPAGPPTRPTTALSHAPAGARLRALRTDGLTWISRALSLTGLAISLYLAYTYLRHQAPVCSTSSGCEIVANSDYARPGGVPLPLAGVIGYLLLLITACMRGQRARAAGMLLTVIAIAASALLTYLELEVIGAICLWCVASAVCASLHVIVNSTRFVRGDPAVAAPS